MIQNTQDNAGEGYAVLGGCCIAVIALMLVPVVILGIVLVVAAIF